MFRSLEPCGSLMSYSESQIRARVLSRLPRPTLARYVTSLDHVRFVGGRFPEPHDWGHLHISRFVGAIRYSDCNELIYTLAVLGAASPWPSVYRLRHPDERIGPPALVMTPDMLSQFIMPLEKCPQIVRMAAPPSSGLVADEWTPLESTTVLEEEQIVKVTIECTPRGEVDFQRALQLDRLLDTASERVVDPPDPSLFCVTPEHYPELWES